MTPTVAVVGPGAIGTTIAAALLDAGITPLLCGRTGRDALTLHTGDTTTVVPGPVLTDPAAAPGPVDVVFLAVKATQTRAAAAWLRALTGPDTIVCALQNGVEQVASITPLVPGVAVVPSVVWFPAVAQSDGSVVLRGPARLTLPADNAGRAVAAVLEDSWCTVELAADFRSVAWRKLLQNAAAGLMVLTGRRAGMFRRDDIGALALAYLDEGLRVARAEGADLADTVPQQILDGFRRSPADLGTSILADREADRPLEWDVRNGIIQRRGRAHGIPTPISDIVVPVLAAASGDENA